MDLQFSSHARYINVGNDHKIINLSIQTYNDVRDLSQHFTSCSCALLVLF